jgi:hypothetical protein
MTWLDSMVWSEPNFMALFMKNRVRTPGDGLLRPMKRGQFRPAERNAYVSEMAKRYHTSVPREKKLRDLEHLVDPTGVVAVAAAQTGTHVVGNQPSHGSPAPKRGRPRPGRPPRGFPALSSHASVSTVASKSVEAVSLPRLPKGKSTTFRASVRAEILGHRSAEDLRRGAV